MTNKRCIGQWPFWTGDSVPSNGVGVGLTRKEKGTKWMEVTDDRGLTLGLWPAGAQRAEVGPAEPTLATVQVPQNQACPQLPVTITNDGDMPS